MTAVGPFAQLFLVWAAMSQAERGDREGALGTATRARRAFPVSNHWAGQFAGCELWCNGLAGPP